jgi:hypothetical protein
VDDFWAAAAKTLFLEDLLIGQIVFHELTGFSACFKNVLTVVVSVM